jgi:hypothetical protein
MQIVNVIAITLIIVLSKRYQNMFCEIHRPAIQTNQFPSNFSSRM